MQNIDLEEYKQLVGQSLGVSRWFEMDQPRIDRFAEVTEDDQFIHVDPEAAARTPFGGTIAHGYLSLSMISAMVMSTVPTINGALMGINYGLNSVRFLKPVGSGKRIRGSFVLKDLQERSAGQWLSTFAVTVEIEDDDKPALVAEVLMLTVIA